MALQTSGAIALSQIAAQFGGSTPYPLSSYYAGGGHVPPGTAGTNGAVPSSGQIAMSKFYGTSAFSAGTYTFTSSGSWTVPSGYHQIVIEVWGAGGGGGGGGISATGGGTAGPSQVTGTPTTLWAGGGGGGAADTSFCISVAGGGGGAASGGDVNATGAAGDSAGNGGNGVNGSVGGGAGGGSPTNGAGGNGGSPGAGGGGGGKAKVVTGKGFCPSCNIEYWTGGGGGAGGYCKKTYAAGQLSAGANLTISISGGAPGGSGGTGGAGGAGGNGMVIITTS